ncbi:MAG: transporter permease, partial [Marivirga sp.]|nr:transporter permease [Marivirga sp.]
MKSTIKIYLRDIKRSKLSFAVNLIGLSSGLACTFLIYLWVRDEMSVDKFHEKDSRLYQIMLWYKSNDSDVTTAIIPGVVAEELSKNIPEIEKAVAVLNSIRSSTLSNDNKALKANGIYASADFFEIFSFDLIDGHRESVLSNESNIVISEELALKLFGTTQNIIGKYVEFDKKEEFVISGVVNNVPSNSSIQFDFALSLPVFVRHTGIEISWGESMANTYVLLSEHSDLTHLNSQMLKWLEKQGEDITKAKLFARSFSDGYLYGNYEANAIQSGGRIDYVKLFSIVGIIILLIACINFISLSTAMASRRLKEVSMKKVLGANRKSIIFQHLGESTILAFISLSIALLLVFVLLPSFNELAGKQIALRWSGDIVSAFFTITLLTGLLGGAYPAFYISGFEAGVILKDNLSNSLGGQWIRKGLIVTQFAVSVILIIMTLVVYNQFSMIQNRNLGYNKDGIIYFDMDGDVIKHREAFLSELRKNSSVHQASSTYALTTKSSFFGADGSTDHLNWPGKGPDESVSMNYRIVDYDLIELLDMEMKEGRSYSRDFNSEVPEIIFNETAIKVMGLKNPIGSQVELWQKNHKIIGVIKDFYFESVHAGNIKPMFLIRDPGQLNTIMVKVNGMELDKTISEIEQFHSRFNPGYPFMYKFLDQDFQNLYSTERRMSVLSRYFAGLAILISCLGLFGLTAFTINRRKKEISTRKVLGA